MTKIKKVRNKDGEPVFPLTHFRAVRDDQGNTLEVSLQELSEVVNNMLTSGYMYAGIAIPTTNPDTPASKCFYIAKEQGTYTNFNSLELTSGINILKWDGTTWSTEQVIGIDDEPTAESENLVKSGGIKNELAFGAVYDVSAKNPTAGPNNDGKFESLSALLSDANLNTLIPTAVRKGGMSIKYVQSSDNKYVQYFLTKDEWSASEGDWEKMNLEEEISQLGQKVNEKVDINSINLINPETMTENKGINSSGVVSTNSDLMVTDYIPVSGQDIVSNGYFTAYWGGAVYNHEKTLIRPLSGAYSYQEGDAYIRLSFLKTATNPTANYGDTLTEEPYNPISQYLLDYAQKKYVDSKVFVEGLKYVEFGSLNLVDEDSFTPGKGINASGVVSNNNDMNLSDYIPVRGQNIISNAWFNAYWGGAVYDKDKTRIRVLSSSQYTFQEGDVYIRLSFAKINTEPRANYGDSLLPYSKYNPIEKYLNGVQDSIQTISEEEEILATANTLNEYSLELELGTINGTTGANASSNTDSRTIGFIPITEEVRDIAAYVGNTRTAVVRRYYNSEKAYLGSSYSSSAVFVRFVFGSQLIDEITLRWGEHLYSNGKYRKNLSSDDIEDIGNEQIIASGELSSDKSYNGEVSASPISANGSANPYNGTVGVGWKKINRRNKRKNRVNHIIAVNHDDIPVSDYAGNRLIYNKYGYNVNFNFILLPFSSISEKEFKSKCIKDMLNDGHDLGLHAIMNKTYWFANKLFDIRPDSTFTFAPTLTDLKGPNDDGTGENAFGKNITSTTKTSEMYLNYPTGIVGNYNIASLTEEQLAAITRCFVIYTDYAYTITGLDLNDESATKTTLQWLEYWYNELIDSTLGFSSEKTSIADKFGDDYEIPSDGSLAEYYPDATHLLNGKIVFFDDTTNPNYNNDEYQKVGRFSRGLFKGCASCCNYEVMDRVVNVAKAFIRHYFGVERFTSYGRHGVGYFNGSWSDAETGFRYANSGKSVLYQETAPLYFTRTGKWQSQFDVLKYMGIRNINTCLSPFLILEGQVGLYFGQKEIRQPFFNVSVEDAGSINYLNFFGTAASETMTIPNYSTFLNGLDDWLKFAYEKAGQSVTRNGKTYTVFNYLRHFINVIRACDGTGKIPLFSWDTIAVNPAISEAINLVCRYCYENDIAIVPIEQARELAVSMKARRGANMFPNPKFGQKLLKYFGGHSEAAEAFVPDGWYYGGKLSSVSVDKQMVASAQRNVLNVVAGSNSASLQCKIYGIEPGNYKLSFYIMSTSQNTRADFFIKKNRDYIEQTYGNLTRFSPAQTFYPTSEWTLCEYEFTIEEPVLNQTDVTDDVNIMCSGYEDNVSNIILKLSIPAGENIHIAYPKIKPLTDLL